MKILLSYLVTQNLASTFRRNQELQKRLHSIDHLESLIISDAPSQAAVGFGADAKGFKPSRFISSSHITDNDGEFAISVARNIALDHAQNNNFDLLLLLDADVVLLEDPVVPENAFTLTWTYFCDENESGRGAFALADPSKWRGGTGFVLKRECLGLRFFEGFKGYGYQDIDFQHNVLVPVVGEPSHWSTKSVHVWHQPRPPFPSSHWEANKVLLIKRLVETKGDGAFLELEKWGTSEMVGMAKVYKYGNPQA